jgi:hypothetical protein
LTKPLPLTLEIEAIARRVNWFEEPAQALAYPARFLAYVMTYGTFQDVAVIRKFWTENDLQAALLSAPPGIFDGRSWAYWNLMLGRYPTPPMPERTFNPA